MTVRTAVLLIQVLVQILVQTYLHIILTIRDHLNTRLSFCIQPILVPLLVPGPWSIGNYYSYYYQVFTYLFIVGCTTLLVLKTTKFQSCLQVQTLLMFINYQGTINTTNKVLLQIPGLLKATIVLITQSQPKKIWWRKRIHD